MNVKKYSVIVSFFAASLFLAQQTFAQVKQATLQQIDALIKEKNSRTPTEQKIDSRLLQAVRESQGQQMASGVKLEPADVKADKTGNLNVDISANVTDELVSRIEKLGAKIIFPSVEYHTIRATINLSMVKTMAAYPEVQFIAPAEQARTVGSTKLKEQTKTTGNQAGLLRAKLTVREREANLRKQLIEYLKTQSSFDSLGESTGGLPITSEGVRDHRVDDARNKYGYSGEGIKIGVLSDSYNAKKGAAADVASGNLPGKGNPFGDTKAVTVVQDFTLLGLSTDEGRAMLQIVYDMVPKAQLFFATASSSEASFASNIKKLRATYGCNIILDDVSYADEPAFEDGVVAQAVNTVTAEGALYFSSAGNAGSVAKGTACVFEGDFNDAGSLPFSGGSKSGTIQNFGTVSAPVNGDIITSASTSDSYSLNWSDPLGKSANDYDLFLVSSTGAVKASSTNVQNGTQNPFESMSAKALVTGDRLVVFKTNAAAKRAFHLDIVSDGDGLLSIATDGQTIGHASAAGAFCVAAAPATGTFGGPYPNPFSTSSPVESFSSDGPRRIFFNADTTAVTAGNFLFGTNGGVVRLKPDVTAADGVSTTFAASTGLSPFYGTSAAAPHAGSIAALLLSANPTLTPAHMRTLLTTTTVDVEAPGYDNISGYGILQAYQAMSSLSPTPSAYVILDSVGITDGTGSNHNGSIDPGEAGNIVVRIGNISLKNATAVKGTLTTSTSGVTITQAIASYGPISANGGTAINTSTPYTFKLGSSVTCGSVINFFLKVAYGGGKSTFKTFEFTVNVGSQPYNNIAATLGTPKAGAGYTTSTGTQIGRLSRGSSASACGTLLANPGILASAGLDPRLFDAYKFTNTTSGSQCVTTTMKADSGLNLYCAAFNDSGFVPSSPSMHFLADPGQSATTETYSFTVAAGDSFTIVVNEVNAGTLSGTPYSLSVSLSNCSAAPQALMAMSLTANADQNKQVPLALKVSNEASVHHYEIEHSTDGSHFSTLTSVSASTSADDEKTYSSNDALPASGNNFYRVKEVDKSGNALYSNVVMVNINNTTGLTIAPNPASSFVTVYSKTTIQQIQLLSPNGRVLQTATPNATVHQLQVGNLAAGQYFLRIETATGVINQKFIKQ